MPVNERFQAGHEMGADRRGVCDQLLPEQLDRCHRGGAGYRVSAKGAGVRAGRPRHDIRPGRGDTERHARRDALRHRDHIRPDAGVLDREHLAGAPHPGLDFVGDEEDAMLLRDRAQALHELVGRHDVAALALNRLHDDRRDLVGRHQVQEDLLFEILEARRGAASRRGTERRAILVRVRRVIDARHHRAEAAPLNRLARGERQGAERASMEAAEKCDDVLSLHGVPRELDARFDRFRPRVSEERPHASVNRHGRRDLLRQAHLELVVKVGPRHVQELLRLIGNRLHDVRVRMSGRGHGDARGAVQKDVAVHVLDHRAAAALDDQGIRARIRRRDDRLVAIDQGLCPGTGQGGFERRDAFHDDVAPRIAKIQSTCVSSGCPRGCLPAARRVLPDRRGCGPRWRNPGAGGRRGGPRSGADGCSSSARRRLSTPSTRSNPSNASTIGGTSPVPISPASIAELRARTSTKIAPSASAVLRSSCMASANALRASLTCAAIAGCDPDRVTAPTRARQSVSRRSPSSAWARLAHVKFSCLR